MAPGFRAAERQARDGANVIFELAGVGAFDGPVAGVVHTWRHFVRDQLATLHEEFDGQHANVLEMFQQLARRALCLAGERRVPIRRTRHAQYAVTMHVEIEWIERERA
jgi:hypothetical protein